LLLGILSASKPGSWIDSAVTTAITLLFAIPVFVYAIVLGYLLSIKLGWLPVGRYVSPSDDLLGFIQRATLPVLALSLMPMAVVARTARTALIEQRNQEYVKLAFAKGLSARRVLLRHITPNALVPVAAVTGLQFGQLLASSVLVEFAFNWPGLNLYMIQGIGRRDYPAVVGVVIVISLAFVFVNLLTELIYGWLDPRVSVSRER
jgi:peptide/nickel transport system permease protein